jgi:hypothetical protein
MAGNAYYYSMQNHLTSCLRFKNKKIKIDITVILPGVLYGCETSSSILRKEPRLRMFKNRVLRRIFGHMKDEVKWCGEFYIIRSLVICTSHQILFGCPNRPE